MTVERFKTFPGCEAYTDEEAQEIIHSLERLAFVLYNIVQKNETVSIDNQLVVPCNETQKRKSVKGSQRK